MSTIKDVAKYANVSIATVSAVINNNSKVNVSPELTERVEKAVKELNYRPNRIARALSKKKTNTIAYIIPSISNPFFSHMTEKIEDLASKKDYGVYICNTGSDKNRLELYKNNLIESRVDGVIITLTWLIKKSDFVQSFKEENIPIVGLAGARIIDNIDTVVINDQQGGYFAAEHIYEKGYSNPAFIGVKKSKTTKERLKGIKKYIKEKENKEFDPEYIKLGSNFSKDEGYNLMGKLLAKNINIDSVIVYNDVMASGVMNKLQEEKIKIPEEIALIGFDNSFSNYTNPKLTTLDLVQGKMASESIKLLFSKIDNNSENFSHKKVTPYLIERETT